MDLLSLHTLIIGLSLFLVGLSNVVVLLLVSKKKRKFNKSLKKNCYKDGEFDDERYKSAYQNHDYHYFIAIATFILILGVILIALSGTREIILFLK